MVNKVTKKHVINNIGNYCQQLINDFFNFAEGNLAEIRVITEFRDISEPMPPKPEQLGKMLARLNRVWEDYCDTVRLPRESKTLFMNKVKKRWQLLEKTQIQVRKRKTKGEKRNP